VGYRAFVLQQARRLGLAGRVRNCPDGSVEVTAEGAGPRLEELLRLLARGPSAAAVAGVESAWEDPTGEWTAFDVAY
jgi:acylphosphatase